MSFEIQPSLGWTSSPHATDAGIVPFSPASMGLSSTPSMGLGLGPQYLINDDGLISPAHGDGKGGKGGGGSAPPPPTGSSAPSPTLVGSSTGVQFDLIWDSSVGSAPSGFVQAVTSAAQTLVSDITTREVVNVHVGYNEIAGSAMGSGDLGESESYGYLANYATITNALGARGYSFSASNEPTSGQFFMTSAETKSLGLISPTSTSLDGYVGFSGAYPMSYATTGTIASNQYSLYSIAEHELTEVMGRLGIEDTYRYNSLPTYTPLDLFHYSSPGALTMAATGGYFSMDNGATNLGTYNNARTNGGDVADWSSLVAHDSFDAFTSPGYIGAMTHNDLLEVAALGYTLSSLA